MLPLSSKKEPGLPSLPALLNTSHGATGGKGSCDKYMFLEWRSQKGERVVALETIGGPYSSLHARLLCRRHIPSAPQFISERTRVTVPSSQDEFRKLHITRRTATAAIRHHPDLTALKLAVGAKQLVQWLRQSCSDWQAASVKQMVLRSLPGKQYFGREPAKPFSECSNSSFPINVL